MSENLKHKVTMAGLSFLLFACQALPPLPQTPVPLPDRTGSTLFLPTPNARERDILKETAKYYSLFSRIPAAYSTGFENLNLPMTPEQQYLLFRAFNANDVAAMGSTQAQIEQALNEGRAYGIALCSDSRCPAPFNVPQAKTFADQFTGIVQQGDSIDNFLTTDKKGYNLIESRTVGAQPTIFPKGTKASIFAPHAQTCLPGVEKCGFNDAISVFLGPGGEETLRNHHVPEGVIAEIKTMISEFDQPGKARSWAEKGAAIQAKLNNHPVMFGVVGHADNSFEIGGMAFPSGRIVYDVHGYDDLAAIAKFMHDPHPELSSLTTQKPGVITWVFSRDKTVNTMYGEMAKEKGVLFASTLTDFTPGKKLTLEEIKKVANGGSYATGHLENEGVLTLVADSLDDMVKIDAELNLNRKAYGLDTFFSKNGVIIKLVPDRSGKFKMMAIETGETFGKGGSIVYELAAGGKGVKNAGITEDVVSYLIRLAEVKKNAGYLSPLQFDFAVNTLKAAKYTTKAGLWVLDFIGTYYIIKDGSYFLNDEIFRKGILTGFQMEKTVTYENKKAKTISIKRTELVKEHANAMRQIISNKDPRWNNRIGKVLSVNLTTYPVGPDALFTIDNQEIFFLYTDSPISGVKQNGKFTDIIHEPFDITTDYKIEKQTIALVDPDGQSMRSDVPDLKIVTSINSNQPNVINYWIMTVDPLTDSFMFTFLQSVEVNPEQFKQTLESLVKQGAK